MPDKTGISIVICCYNSSKRLKKTLEALANQKFDGNISSEIIVVDNASTDNTAKYAESLWESLNAPIPLRTVHESKPGLSHARKRGIEETSYSYILFCDDDNWLFPNYINKAYHIINNDSTIGACGGMGIPKFEIRKPYWFDEYSEAFALGSQEIVRENGVLLNLYGAGLTIRKKALTDLSECGFTRMFAGRVGSKLSSSEDTELTNGMVLLGYKLHFCEQLKFYHYLPKERLNFTYLKKLFIAFGTDGPVRDLYYACITKRASHRFIKNWYLHFSISILRLLKYLIMPPKKYGRGIYFYWSIAYIKELLGLYGRHKTIRTNIMKLKKTRPVISINEYQKSESLVMY